VAGNGGPARTLREAGLRPRKSLGQNFLRDRSYLARIAEAADIGPEDVVLELGAGTGVLTAELVRLSRRVLAVELDDHLVEVLRREFESRDNLTVWHGNALDFDPCAHFEGRYKLVGNIPYYITGPIIRHYLEAACQPSVLVLMVQREVADRIVAEPGDLSLLGVSVQFYGEARIVARVPRRAFHPAPKVDSAIIRIIPHADQPEPGQRDAFFALARAGFGTRRKTLANALGIGLGWPKESAQLLLSEAEIDSRRRAEDLSVAEWRHLARLFSRGGGR
jgi:16S rRNA (adenine1518-N6/adenine1519-N6)-dimethyltransferase